MWFPVARPIYVADGLSRRAVKFTLFINVKCINGMSCVVGRFGGFEVRNDCISMAVKVYHSLAGGAVSPSLIFSGETPLFSTTSSKMIKGKFSSW